MLIGWCGLSYLEQTREVEIGYGIAKPFWGKGLASEAASATIAVRISASVSGSRRGCRVAGQRRLTKCHEKTGNEVHQTGSVLWGGPALLRHIG